MKIYQVRSNIDVDFDMYIELIIVAKSKEQVLTIAKDYGQDADKQRTEDTTDEVGIYTGNETEPFLLSD